MFPKFYFLDLWCEQWVPQNLLRVSTIIFWFPFYPIEVRFLEFIYLLDVSLKLKALPGRPDLKKILPIFYFFYLLKPRFVIWWNSSKLFSQCTVCNLPKYMRRKETALYRKRKHTTHIWIYFFWQLF